MIKPIDLLFNLLNALKRRARLVYLSTGPQPYVVETRKTLFHPWVEHGRFYAATAAINTAYMLNSYGDLKVIEK